MTTSFSFCLLSVWRIYYVFLKEGIRNDITIIGVSTEKKIWYITENAGQTYIFIVNITYKNIT